jgi:O-antigen ligase
MRNITFKLSLALIFLMPWEGIIRFPGLGTGTKLLGFALAALWLATVVITGRLRKPHPFHIMVFLFVLWNAVSIFWSHGANRTLAHLATWMQLLALVFILWDLYTTEAAIRAGLQAYILGAYVAIGSAIYNYFSGNAFYTHYQRFSAGATNPDGFGFILVLGMPLAWYLATTPNTNKSRFWTFINYAYIPFAYWGIALSGTRTALIASIIASLYGLTTLNRVRPWRQAVLILVLILTANYALPNLASLKSFQRLGTTGTELTQGDLNNRTNNWREGINSFLNHPFLGVGGNMYRSVNSWDKVGHNSYLSILVELGLIGFVLFAGILMIAFARAWSLRGWEAWFWLTVLAVWATGASTLTWEGRKTTWLFLTLIIARAAINVQREESETLVDSKETEFRGTPGTQLPQGAAD